MDAAALRDKVRPDRIHRSVYTDPAIFDLEMARIFGRAWIYVGHASQVPNPGDYAATRIGRQPVVMVRHGDGSIRVLHNRCGHKGAEVVGNRCGSVRFFRCCYHGWTFKTDGSLHAMPRRHGYDGTPIDLADPRHGMMPVARCDSYRGFVFASLAADGPDLKAFLGAALSSIDDMVDRAPDGELEVAGGVFRVMQRSNWKIFMENLNDGMHPMVVHQSSIDASRDQAADLDGAPPLALKIMIGNGEPYEFWERLSLTTTPNGHSWMGGIVSARGGDPVFAAYKAELEKRHGAVRTEEILAVERHNTIFYPNVSIQSSFQQIRVLHPQSVDRTLVEIWSFRLKGAPEAMYQRTLTYSNVVNSPASIVMPDDIEAYRRVQTGLLSDGADWVSLHRDAGRDRETPLGLQASTTSELPMRNQFKVWLDYMTAGAAA